MSRRTASPSTGCRTAPLLALGLALSLELGAGLAAAKGPAPQELIARMEAAQRDLHTLTAEFVQTSHVKLFKQELRSEGRLLYERAASQPAQPNFEPTVRLRWEYLRPEASTLVLFGEQAQMRMGKAGGSAPTQTFDLARDANMRAIFAQLRLWLGLGGAAAASLASPDIAREYDMRTGGDSAKPALLLFPRPGSLLGKTFSRIELHLDGRTWQLLRLLLVEQSGDEKEISFTRIQRNVALPASAFSL